MVDADDFRNVTGQFATGVTVVTVGADEPHGMTVNSFASVSLDPPLVLFNADKETNTHDHVAEADHYAVNILSEDQEWISDRFAGEHHEMADPFEDIPITTAATGAPIIEGSIAYLDCTLAERYPGGDHTIYLGEVEELSLEDATAKPLTFFRGQYGTVD
ncbi:flavin reductase family protein [Natrinema caseinilyticum]|uniref:flavin reductase family protein n=1 Tax=Natrinema caseinilyticum TaxID=2961570 RepID=UPI0020C434F6|nr:flavin reductase family protein [Natrinema caseinilyticum]